MDVLDLSNAEIGCVVRTSASVARVHVRALVRALDEQAHFFLVLYSAPRARGRGTVTRGRCRSRVEYWVGIKNRAGIKNIAG